MTADESGRKVVEAPRPKPFRPREIWAGTIVMLVAIFVGAAAVIVQSLVLAVIAAAIFAIGALLAWHGRILRDTHAVSPIKREWCEVKDPESTDPVGLDPNEKGRLDQDGS